MSFIKGLIGCVIGGCIGAAIWALVAYFTGYEIGILATAVGALCGVGMAVGSKDDLGLMTGVVACVVALLSILGGKLAVVHTMVSKHLNTQSGQSVFTRPVDEKSAVVFMADQLVDEYEGQGKKLDWPKDSDPDDAEKAEQFPKDLWADATARWGATTDDQKSQYIKQMEEARQSRVAAATAVVDGAVLFQSFSLFDALWAFLALGAAFRIGSGNGGGD